MPLPETSEEDWPSIRSGPLEARFRPANGGRMTHLAHDRLGNILVPTKDTGFDPLNWPKAGAYPLFPYHNRLIGAAFEHGGQHYKVQPHPAVLPDAQHGPAHRRAWRIASHQPDRIELTIDYKADEDWPFDFRAVQRFLLTDERVDVELSLANTGSGPMVGSFGWHPYLAAGLDQPTASDARKVWPVSSSGIPSGSPPEERQGERLRHERFTIFLSEWRQATASLNDGARIRLTAGAELPHLVAHRTDAYICLEPVSHVAGALNFPTHARTEAGLFSLGPGEKRSAHLSLEIGSGL